MKTKRTKSKTAATVDRWGRHHARTVRSTTRKLRGNVSADRLVEVVRDHAAEVRKIPATLRAMEHAMADATALVVVLEDCGVVFADTRNAPTQIAGAMYAAWLSCHNHRDTDPVDWLGAASMVPLAVAWAVHHKTGTPPEARDMLAAATGARGRRRST